LCISSGPPFGGRGGGGRKIPSRGGSLTKERRKNPGNGNFKTRRGLLTNRDDSLGAKGQKERGLEKGMKTRLRVTKHDKVRNLPAGRWEEGRQKLKGPPRANDRCGFLMKGKKDGSAKTCSLGRREAEGKTFLSSSWVSQP